MLNKLLSSKEVNRTVIALGAGVVLGAIFKNMIYLGIFLVLVGGVIYLYIKTKLKK